MQSKRAVLISIGILLIVVIVYTWATWQYFTIPVPGGNDFLAHYSVWDLFIREGVNPYSDEAAIYTQELIRGRAAQPGEDQNRLIYPFYSILVHGPLTFLEYDFARAVYMVLLQAGIILSVIITLRLFEWDPRKWIVVSLFAWSILHYPEARAVILGQFAPFAFLSLVGALYLLKRGNDLLAGIILVVSTMKPTLVFLVIPFIFLWAIRRKRWIFLASFIFTMATATIISLFLLPTWIGDWISRILNYPTYTGGESPIWLLTHEYLPMLGSSGEWILSILLIVSLLLSWWKCLKHPDDREFYWTLGFTILISNLVVPRSATTNYVMFLLPTIGFFASMDRAWVNGARVVFAVMLISVIGHWWLHAITIVGNREQPELFLPIPVILGVGLLMGRSFFLEHTKTRRAMA